MAEPPRRNTNSGRSRQASNDDISVVKQLDEAESRARAMKRIADEEARRADEADARARAAEQERLRMQRELDAALTASQAKPLVVEPAPRSIPPTDGVTIHHKGKKYVIRLGLLVAAAPFVATLVQRYMTFVQWQKGVDKFMVNQGETLSKYDLAISTLQKDHTALREVVADQAGFLRGALPKVGANVTAESGATQIDVKSDPLPSGMAQRKLVNITTPIPAPAPKPGRP